MGRVCANASLHWGPWLQRGLAVTGKQAEAQARVCVRTRSTLFTSNQGGLFFLLVPEGVVFIHSPAVSEGYIYVRHALLVVSGLALCEWGFNWDLPSFRVVLCLRCLVLAVFIRRFTPLRPDFFKGTARLRRNTAEYNVFLPNPPLS